MNPLESIAIRCPYCGEGVDVTIETTTARQSLIEDCPVCCRPMCLQVCIDGDADAVTVHATREDA